MLQSLLWILFFQLEMKPVSSHKTPDYTFYQRGSTVDVRPETKGGFVLMGGGTDVDEAFEWMAERSGGGDFLVLRGSGADGYQDYIDELTEVNSVSTLVLNNKDAASDPFVLDKVDKAEAIFFAGGDQWNYVGKWKDTPLQAALNRAILDGIPMGGTSAGLAILGEHVFSAEVATVTTPEALEDPYHPSITLESDFLKAPPLHDLITDSHFSERDRLGRLVSFMGRLQQDGDQQTVRGVGVDERTAVLVDPDGAARVVGEGGAHFVQAQGQPEICRPGEPLTHHWLELHSVNPGQSFSLEEWQSLEVEPQSIRVEAGTLTVGDPATLDGPNP